jgi:hypothetical protein
MITKTSYTVETGWVTTPTSQGRESTMRTTLLSLLLSTLSLSSFGQTGPRPGAPQSSTQPTKYKAIAKRDPQALGVLSRAVAELGGAQTITKMSLVVADGTATTAEGTKPVHWETKNNSFRMQTGAHIFASNGDVGWREDDAGRSKLPPHVWASTVVPTRLGGYLFEALTETTTTVQEAPEKSDDKAVALLVRDEHTALCHALCTHYWYFDRQTNLPTKVDFQERSLTSANFFIWTTLTFEGFTNVGGVNGPMQFTYRRLGLPAVVVTLTSLRPGVSVDDTRFAISTGAAQ